MELLVSHSPERVIPGRVFEELVSNDRIIGGVNEESAKQTTALYQSFVKGTMHETDATTAELVKVMENTYRDVNIAFANELAKLHKISA
ncbi:UDP-N-acetyl-D-mannosamine dehydrogenase, partial [Leptospira santarosai]|nr:UDP-N-acetyl-D-mannosamine dehydrogenase [Leptospira santarosai]